MSYLEGLIDDLNIKDFDTLEKLYKPLDDVTKAVGLYFQRVNKVIQTYRETGNVPDLSSAENWEDCLVVGATRNSVKIQSSKENVKPPQTDKAEVKQEKKKSESPPRTRRTRRNALKENTQNTRATRRTKRTETVENVQVKVEKLSIAPKELSKDDIADSIEDVTQAVVVKTEMPAPTKPAPRKKKKEVQAKQEKKSELPERDSNINRRDSDVVIQDVTVTTINLVESFEEKDQEPVKIKKEKRETAAKKKQNKRSRTSSSEEVNSNNEHKRSKSNEEEATVDYTEFEDAVSTLDTPAADATFVAQKQPEAQTESMNATIVVENPKLVKSLVPQRVEDLMTDDESFEEPKKKKSPIKPIRGIPKPIKPVFSPFAQSPVKQKVQAFEKLHEEASAATTTRITRTKTRQLAKEQEVISAEPVEQEEPKNMVKEKAKLFTPIASKFVPKAASTNMKPSRPLSHSSSNETLLSAKSASALKASQAEYRERERKRKEKEQEVLKKREALLQAQIEEKKRKREEKQLKAQQQRELLDKEKMKVLEAQKLKDERHKRLIAEQEEKKQKLREEMEKKRMMAKLRAIEEKKREEEKRLEEQRKQEEMAAKLARRDEEMVKMLQNKKQKQIPIYLRSRAPLLPTGDCYDSDDEEARSVHFVLPNWNKESNLRFMQRCAFAGGESLKNSFFSIQAQTPDLQEIFEVIEPQKLKRSSSAVWHKPPRFTMVPQLDNHDETEEFDDE